MARRPVHCEETISHCLLPHRRYRLQEARDTSLRPDGSRVTVKGQPLSVGFIYRRIFFPLRTTHIAEHVPLWPMHFYEEIRCVDEWELLVLRVRRRV